MLPPVLLVQHERRMCSAEHCLISTSCKMITGGVKSLPNIYKHFLRRNARHSNALNFRKAAGPKWWRLYY